MTFYLSTETLPLPFSTAKISFQGFDIDNTGNWIAIVESEAGLRLRTPWSDIRLPVDLPYAMVRWLDGKAMVVFSRISEADETNAWIIDPQEGVILKAFSVGDGVQDVLVFKDFIAVSYFDEGVLGFVSPSNEGLAIFAKDGTYLWGYTSGVKNPVYILDCYAMCPTGSNRLAFFAYTDFDFVEIDLVTREQIITPTPDTLHGCGAITCQADTVFFRGPYPASGQDRSAPREAVFAFDKNKGQAVEILPLPGKSVRGLSQGRMLAIGDGGVVVATFLQ